jgi:hypothetical protein
VTFMDLCGDRAPHFTTIAKFRQFVGRGHRPCLCGGAGGV